MDTGTRQTIGEVWRAKDTKLGCEVAIKTLPSEFAQDADRPARFEREAKLLASLAETFSNLALFSFHFCFWNPTADRSLL